MIGAFLALIFGLVAGGLGVWISILAHRLREDGRREAELEAARAALASAEKAAVVAEKAKQTHAKDPSDGAFDPDFWRD